MGCGAARQPADPERRREKNRIAQRRFRERQKSTVCGLQVGGSNTPNLANPN
jgi:hypothetical protein